MPLKSKLLCVMISDLKIGFTVSQDDFFSVRKLQNTISSYSKRRKSLPLREWDHLTVHRERIVK